VKQSKKKMKKIYQNKAKAMIFIRRHLHGVLKAKYLTYNDPLVLWNKLKERYGHKKTVIVPKARYDRFHLRLQDYKSSLKYNSTMFKITSQLLFCREKVSDEKYIPRLKCVVSAII
jgi:hypothetical protein